MARARAHTHTLRDTSRCHYYKTFSLETKDIELLTMTTEQQPVCERAYTQTHPSLSTGNILMFMCMSTCVCVRVWAVSQRGVTFKEILCREHHKKTYKADAAHASVVPRNFAVRICCVAAVEPRDTEEETADTAAAADTHPTYVHIWGGFDCWTTSYCRYSGVLNCSHSLQLWQRNKLTALSDAFFWRRGRDRSKKSNCFESILK